MTNAGGFNPAALAATLREIIAAEGVALRVSHVDGDNILRDLPALQAAGHRLENLDSGAPLSSWGHSDCECLPRRMGIAAALDAGTYCCLRACERCIVHARSGRLGSTVGKKISGMNWQALLSLGTSSNVARMQRAAISPVSSKFLGS
jgi:Acyclic terpene utilisation family protein AtuA